MSVVHPHLSSLRFRSQSCIFFKCVELNMSVCLQQSPDGWALALEFPLCVGTCNTVSITYHYYYSPTNYLFNVFQGPLEKSLQNSVVSERQRNVEHKVSAIKNSAQVPFLSCVLSLPTWFSYRHTWTTFKMGSTTSANRHTIRFPFFQGHLPRPTTQDTPDPWVLAAVWVQCQSSLFWSYPTHPYVSCRQTPECSKSIPIVSKKKWGSENVFLQLHLL